MKDAGADHAQLGVVEGDVWVALRSRAEPMVGCPMWIRVLPATRLRMRSVMPVGGREACPSACHWSVRFWATADVF